jgi:Tfp pilus assembly protein PilV
MTSKIHQRGMGLIEVLVAFLVLSVSVLGAHRLQSALRLTTDIAKQRSEAVRLAQQDMELSRSLSDNPGSLVNRQQAVEAQNARYTLQRQVSDVNGLVLKPASVQAQWTDRTGETQQVRLVSAVNGMSSIYSAALTLLPNDLTVGRPVDRHDQVPRGAKDLGDGRSVLKPDEHGRIAWVLDNATGEVLTRCTVASNVATHQLTMAHLSECDRIRGSLLSGHVRFAPGDITDVRRANDAALPFDVSLVLRGASNGQPTCGSQPMMTAQVTRAGRTSTQTVAIGSTLASLGASAVQDTGEHFVAFTCLVVDARWSGRLVFAPQGWSLGITARDRKVCRVGETPADYREVQGALRQQNFLVIRGDLPCPDDATHNVTSAGGAQHQP